MANRGGLFKKTNEKAPPELVEETITKEEHEAAEESKKVSKQPAPIIDKKAQDK